MNRSQEGRKVEKRDGTMTWWLCAYYDYLDGDQRWDHADDDETRARAISSLQTTLQQFGEGKLNLGTLKYRLDEAFAVSNLVFPGRKVSSILQDLAMSVPLEVLEPALRAAVRLPDDPGEAKGALMDLEEILEGEVSRGRLARSQAQPERWPLLLSCLWHVLDPLAWPVMSESRIRCLRKMGEMDGHDYPEYTSVMRRLSVACGASMTDLDHLLDHLTEGGGDVPGTDECLRRNMDRADECAAQGRVDEALEHYERVLSIEPRSYLVFFRKAELYESKGLVMAAIGEMEALLEVEPSDLKAHRKLLSLYRSQNMVHEHNIEVRRYKALREAKG